APAPARPATTSSTCANSVGLAILGRLHDARGDADHHRARGHVGDHHRVGANLRAVADRHGAQDLRAGAHVHVRAQAGRVVRAVEPAVADGHPLSDDRPIADGSVAVDDDGALVLDPDAPPDVRRVRDLDAVEVAHAAEQGLVEQTQRGPQRPLRDGHPPGAEPVHQQGLKPRPGPVAVVCPPILDDLGEEADALAGSIMCRYAQTWNPFTNTLWRTKSRKKCSGSSWGRRWIT